MTIDVYPSVIRKQILHQHRELRAMLEEIQELSEHVLQGEQDCEAPLRKQAEALYESLGRHLDVEDAFLAPALRDTDAFGKDRADQLLVHHAEQRKQLEEALWALRDDGRRIHDIATSLLHLVHDLRIDMAHEEKDLLNEKLLRDDPIRVDIFTG